MTGVNYYERYSEGASTTQLRESGKGWTPRNEDPCNGDPLTPCSQTTGSILANVCRWDEQQLNSTTPEVEMPGHCKAGTNARGRTRHDYSLQSWRN